MKRISLFACCLMLTISLSAEQYCRKTLTANGKNIRMTAQKVSDGKYQLLIETDEAITGLGGSYVYVNDKQTYQLNAAGHFTLADDKLSVVCNISSSTVPVHYTPLYVVFVEGGEVNFGEDVKNSDYSLSCDDVPPVDNGNDEGDDGKKDGADDENKEDNGEKQEDSTLTEGSCSGTSTEVDGFYSGSDKEHAITSLSEGYTWQARTTTAGVELTVRILDKIEGMTAPELFTFDDKGVLIGDPIPMNGWDDATAQASHTLTGYKNGASLVFLVKVACNGGKVLFTARQEYIVGTDCSKADEADKVLAACSGTIRQTDSFYTSNNPAAATSMEKGVAWRCETKASGVTLTAKFLDNLPGMAAPNLYLVDANGILPAGTDPIPMKWIYPVATYTLTDAKEGDELRFLFQIAYELHVLFTDNIVYTVGQNCEEEPEDPQDAVENVAGIEKIAKKVMHNGHLYILHNGNRYSAAGVKVE